MTKDITINGINMSVSQFFDTNLGAIFLSSFTHKDERVTEEWRKTRDFKITMQLNGIELDITLFLDKLFDRINKEIEHCAKKKIEQIESGDAILEKIHEIHDSYLEKVNEVLYGKTR